MSRFDTDRRLVALYDDNGDCPGHAPLSPRCWCNHALGEHYASHCVPGCPCGGDYPPRLPEGKQGFSQAQPEPTVSVCFRCDAELDPARGSVKNALCDLCRRKLQAKVDRAAKEVEFEMVNGSFRKKRPWWKPGLPELAGFVLGLFVRVILHAIGWWL